MDIKRSENGARPFQTSSNSIFIWRRSLIRRPKRFQKTIGTNWQTALQSREKLQHTRCRLNGDHESGLHHELNKLYWPGDGISNKNKYSITGYFWSVNFSTCYPALSRVILRFFETRLIKTNDQKSTFNVAVWQHKLFPSENCLHYDDVIVHLGF